jgi:adenylate cyclase
VYDRFMQWRPALAPDERLLLVEISEQDLQRLQRPTPSDRDLARAIQVLMQHQPSVIGLSLLRDLPQEPGRADFLQQLQRPEVITLFTLGDDGIEIPPPLGIPSDRIGFSDVPLDLDGVIRRNLMFASTSTGSYSSFAVQIALKYLGDRGIAPRNSSAHPDLMQLGDRVVFPLERNSGGYRQLDAGGYQILLDYQSPTPAPVVSFVDVVNDRLDPSLVRGKIVLLGTTAASSKDFFKTPYSAGQALRQMSGLMLHAQMVSQLLRTVLDRRPLFRFLPEWAELLWLVGWAAVGSSVAWLVRRPIALSLGTVALLVGLSSIHFALFINHVWLPVIAPAIAILITSVVTVSYRSKR